MSPCGDSNNPATLDCIGTLIPNIIHAAFLLVGSVTVLMIIMSGIKYITSGGDNKQIDGAKKTLTYAIVGLVVVCFAYLIINIIAYVTGVSCIKTLSFTGC